MHDNRLHKTNNGQRRTTTSVNRIARQAIDQYKGEIDRRNISIDIDMPETVANVHPQTIHLAVSRLLENAILSMPRGGELCVTLVDGASQWELEVADSADHETDRIEPTPPLRDRHYAESGHLRFVRACSRSVVLRDARAAALVHGGQIQTWDCPQGGTANVLVIPRIPQKKAA